MKKLLLAALLACGMAAPAQANPLAPKRNNDAALARAIVWGATTAGQIATLISLLEMHVKSVRSKQPSPFNRMSILRLLMLLTSLHQTRKNLKKLEA